MKVLKESGTNAFMLRNDGKVFEVKSIHPYGNMDIDASEETVWAGEWLYNHTQYEEVRKCVIDFVAAWIYNFVPLQTDDVFSDTVSYLKSEFGNTFVVSEEFLKKVISEYSDIDDAGELDVEQLNIDVNNYLNNEFCRFRYGGSLDTDLSKLGEIYFRISSSGFNWFDIIWKYVYENKRRISYVTIAKDMESTGKDDVYTVGSKKISHMDVDDFIFLKGNPIIENLEIK